MSKDACRFLRPYLYSGLKPASCPAHTRFYVAVKRRSAHSLAEPPSPSVDYQKRVKKLMEAGDVRKLYPRLRFPEGSTHLSPKAFNEQFSGQQKNEIRQDVTVTIIGWVRSHRSAGSKLVFFDLADGGEKVQGLCNWRVLSEAGVSWDKFKRFQSVLRKGDWFAITGHPTRTTTGELSVLATELPQVLAPSLHQVPEDLQDRETLSRNRHVDLLVNEQPGDILRLRHHIEKYLQDFLNDRGFIKVNTPLLTAGAGGAVARPFKTIASEFTDTPLTLRIAPELFLKRLVVGNMGRVYELGPAFRNEGIDATHNPEFSICELYMPFATLEDLIDMTEQMFRGLASHVRQLKAEQLTSLPSLPIDFTSPFQRLDFIPTIEQAVRQALSQRSYRLPKLTTATAVSDLLSLFTALSMPPPSSPTLPKLLDALATRFIEPLCNGPTFITHHPAVLSPLSKSFIDKRNGHVVAARVELFVNGREYVNAYEEENDPFEQRRKFVEQLHYRDDGDGGEGQAEVDESYIDALEWGLPPTGGWGCGVDRLVMLFSGASRIADVLSFGTLRNVVALGQSKRKR